MATTATELPAWFYPGPEGGWTFDDLHLVPADAPRYELIDGALIFMSPQRSVHDVVKFNLRSRLQAQAPPGFQVMSEMAVLLSDRTAPEPDVLVVTPPYQRDRTRYLPSEVLLAIEVVSPESQDRDRKDKPGRYAEAGIAHFWRVEIEPSGIAVHTFELEPTTGTYVATGIERGRFTRPLPYVVNIDASTLES
ncbi:Uma2 family endonuclease [Streptomycetaceae bacterium NBC_01309]